MSELKKITFFFDDRKETITGEELVKWQKNFNHLVVHANYENNNPFIYNVVNWEVEPLEEETVLDENDTENIPPVAPEIISNTSIELEYIIPTEPEILLPTKEEENLPPVEEPETIETPNKEDVIEENIDEEITEPSIEIETPSEPEQIAEESEEKPTDTQEEVVKPEKKKPGPKKK